VNVKDAGRVVAIAVLLAAVAGACGGGSGGAGAGGGGQGGSNGQGQGGPDAAYRFRYTGLKLIVRAGGRWFLLPAGWTPGNRGAALLLPDTDDLRVEFTPGR
jgi:hypothetical protein